MIAGLPRQDPGGLSGRVETGLLLLADEEFLSTPLRDRDPRAKLDREPRLGKDTDIAHSRDGLLPVPEADRRPGPVAVIRIRDPIPAASIIRPMMLFPLIVSPSFSTWISH